MHEDPRITVVGEAPPPPPPDLDQEPYALIVNYLTGYRDPSCPDPAWQVYEITPANFEAVLRDKVKPRFVADVKDCLTGKEGSLLHVDVVLDKRTSEWLAVLLEKVPELRTLWQLVRRMEDLKRNLGRDRAAQRKLEALLRAIQAEAPPRRALPAPAEPGVN